MDNRKREILAGLGLAAAGLVLPTAMASQKRNTVVVVFMRGAVDGLNVVVPHADDDYYLQRPIVRVPRPGENEGAIDLDGFFGLHPSLAALKPIYDAGQLAAVHACGSPHGSRSHFDAQHIMETGIQDPKATLSGWLGRHADLTDTQNPSPFRVVGIAGAAQRALQGAVPPLALQDFDVFDAIINRGMPYMEAMAGLHDHAGLIDLQGSVALQVLQQLQQTQPASLEPRNGASYPNNTFGRNMQKAAQLIRADLGAEVIAVDIGGWDTHVNQNNALRNNLATLGDTLAAFNTDLAADMANVTVVTMSEFGRRVLENGSAGTDHGHGNVMLMMGAGVNGGQVYRQWPGIALEDLSRGDLQVTTDYRSVLSELLRSRLNTADLSRVFPDFAPQPVGVFS